MFLRWVINLLLADGALYLCLQALLYTIYIYSYRFDMLKGMIITLLAAFCHFVLSLWRVCTAKSQQHSRTTRALFVSMAIIECRVGSKTAVVLLFVRVLNIAYVPAKQT